MKIDFIYIGPSWATRSYEDPLGEDTTNQINIGDMLAKEYGYSFGKDKVGWCPEIGVSNGLCCNEIRKRGLPNDVPIVWFSCDPVGNIYYRKENHDMSWPSYVEDNILYDDVRCDDWVESFLTSKDWREKRRHYFDTQLAEMNSLGNPIALMGSHTDVMKEQVEKYENITLIESSWQRVLAEYCGIIPLDDYMGVDFIHQAMKIFIKDKEIVDHMRKSNLSKYEAWADNILAHFIHAYTSADEYSKRLDDDLVHNIHKTYAQWEQFEEAGVFTWVHPNIKGNEIFYDKVHKKLHKFIDTHNANKS